MYAQRSRSFFGLATALMLGASVLTGCVGNDGYTRHLQPLPPKLVAQMTAKGMTPADPILVRIFKQESELEIWKRTRSGEYALLKTWPICRWSGQLGPKMREGDRQAPEGFYTITTELMNPRSQYYLAFNLGYPNTLEQAQGQTGAALMVHGACASVGCYAMTDDGIAEIFALAREAFSGGQTSFQVQALPFRMTPENMARHRNSPNYAFWRNLKEGSDHFEATHQPPTVAACGRRYVFNAREGSGPFLPEAPCPPYQVEASIAGIVAQRQTSDEQRIADLSSDGAPAMSYAYRDGGMHRNFRSLLRQLGPERMQTMVAGKVAISSPEAALADPYNGREEVASPDTTASVGITEAVPR